jgi:intracellular multiplication protein IcmB
MTSLGNENLRADEETAKRRAYALKNRMKELGHEIPLTHAYEALATSCGFRNWPTMKAQLASSTSPHATGAATPAKLGEGLWNEGGPLFVEGSGDRWSFGAHQRSGKPGLDLVFGPPGYGKSTVMQARTLAIIERTLLERDEMPDLVIFDIGPSARGLHELLKARLPARHRESIDYHAVRGDGRFEVNPFDTFLGERHPSASRKVALTEFLALAISDGPRTEPDEEMLAKVLVRAMYFTFSDKTQHGTPLPYTPGTEPGVDKTLRDCSLVVEENATWWQVVDKLARRGEIRAAKLAQRNAMPTLKLLRDFLARPLKPFYIENVLSKISADVQTATTNLEETLRYARFLGGPTSFQKGSSKTMVIDLEGLVPAGGGKMGDKQAQLAFLAMREAVCSEFFLDAAALSQMRDPYYRSVNAEAMAREREAMRYLIIDESHRFFVGRATRRQLLRDVAMSEDAQIDICIASQLMSFSDTIANSATSVSFLHVSPRQIEEVSERFGVSTRAVVAISDEGKAPGADGAVFLALDMKDGVATKETMVRVHFTAKGLWATNGVVVDHALRSKLVAEIGHEAALDYLARTFPRGSASKFITDKMSAMMRDGQKFDGLMDTILEQMSQAARTATSEPGV